MSCMKIFTLQLGACLFLTAVSVYAQTAPATQGMTTYSPYSAEQIKEFNNQPLSPVEGVFGPVNPNSKEFNLSKKPSLDAKYYNQPEGEEEAEALETQSAEPYQSSSPVITF